MLISFSLSPIAIISSGLYRTSVQGSDGIAFVTFVHHLRVVFMDWLTDTIPVSYVSLTSEFSLHPHQILLPSTLQIWHPQEFFRIINNFYSNWSSSPMYLFHSVSVIHLPVFRINRIFSKSGSSPYLWDNLIISLITFSFKASLNMVLSVFSLLLIEASLIIAPLLLLSENSFPIALHIIWLKYKSFCCNYQMYTFISCSFHLLFLSDTFFSFSKRIIHVGYHFVFQVFS